MTALHSEEYQRFAQALAEARRRSGLSQYELADRLGADQSYVSKYEHGRRRLDVIEFMRIMAALGGDYREVLSAFVSPAAASKVANTRSPASE